MVKRAHRLLYSNIDYDEIFAPVARYSSIRIIISLAIVFGWKLHEMDVKTLIRIHENQWNFMRLESR
jgi:hypothetical protein